MGHPQFLSFLIRGTTHTWQQSRKSTLVLRTEREKISEVGVGSKFCVPSSLMKQTIHGHIEGKWQRKEGRRVAPEGGQVYAEGQEEGRVKLTGTGEFRITHSRVSWMLCPVDRSITVSAPQMVCNCRSDPVTPRFQFMQAQHKQNNNYMIHCRLA